MSTSDWLLVDLVTLLYNLTWMVFLTCKHYGQVTTTAGHIFELNVLLNVVICNFLLILLVDLEVFSLDSTELMDFSVLVAIAGSQIETMVFLKTMNVNTMMTNTAAKIILAITMFSYGLAIFNRLSWPSTMASQSEELLCDYITPLAIDFKRKCISFSIYTFTLVIVLSVMGFGVFRGLQIRRTSDNEENTDNLNLEEPRTERLFSVQAMLSELNQERPREIVEEDLVIQDIELDSMEVSDQNQEAPRQMSAPHSISQLQETFENNQNLNTMSEVQQDPIGCAPVIDVIMKTIQKHMKNTIISLFILTCSLPWYLALLYGIITNSGCENTNIKFMVEIGEYGWCILTIFLPLFIKLKLDRLSQ